MWMVEENGNAKTEVERLESEIESLIDHQPDVLSDVGVDVDYHGIFCCVDGTMSCKEEPSFFKICIALACLTHTHHMKNHTIFLFNLTTIQLT
jgi:hypothetical protein